MRAPRRPSTRIVATSVTLAAVALGCGDGLAPPPPPEPSPPVPRPLLTVSPSRLVMRVGEQQRLALTTRDQRSLRRLGFWIDGGDGSVLTPITVDGISVVTAYGPGGPTLVRIRAEADGVDTSAVASVFVRGVRFRSPWDTVRVWLTPTGPFTRGIGPASGGVDTVPVSPEVRWRVADTSIVALTTIDAPPTAVLTPRRLGTTALTVSSVARPDLATTVPVVVGYCLRIGTRGGMLGECLEPGGGAPRP
jgi:hypothetical protein